MLKRLTPKEQIEQIALELTPKLRASFMAAVNDILDAVVLRVIVERLERNDLYGAVEALQLDADAFGKVEQAILEAYNAGGSAAVDKFPKTSDPEGRRVVFRWGVRNVAGENELSHYAANLVQNISEDTKVGIRAKLAEGLSQGQNPRATALEIVGQVSPVTGRREGGLIGLTSAQMATVENARRGMIAGDPEAMRSYLGLKLRDKRFDAAVKRALAEGRGLSLVDADKITGRLADRNLKFRADLIAETETMGALSKANHDAILRQIEAGRLNAEDVSKTWRRTVSEHPRSQHIRMAGQTVPFDEPFIAPDGTRIMYPRDPAAGAKHVLGCKCRADYRIDFGRQIDRRYEATAY